MTLQVFATTFRGIVLVLFLLPTLLSAQQSQRKYWVEFTDKTNSPYQLEAPEAFLSERALARRQRQGIALSNADLPVNPQYLERIRQTGSSVEQPSRWFNAVTVIATARQVNAIRRLEFVKRISFLGHYWPKQISNTSRRKSAAQAHETFGEHYGRSDLQIKQMQGHHLHQAGHRGKGILIAVLDGGFDGVHDSPFFEHLRKTNRLWFSPDFTGNEHQVATNDQHGAKVLSVMAADAPGEMMGTASAATYVCIRTEDRTYEARYEMCNWVIGAEYADSIGADIITSSLGYREFDEPWLSYSAAQMDGQQALASRAADMAFERGMLVVTSAGNDGQTARSVINSPADAHHVIAVGASDQSGRVAAFSSEGRTADGRFKPEVLAPGTQVAVVADQGDRVTYASGTSYAAPIVAGLAAALWSAYPEATNRELRQAILRSAVKSHPQAAGRPNFRWAYGFLKADELIRNEIRGFGLHDKDARF